MNLFIAWVIISIVYMKITWFSYNRLWQQTLHGFIVSHNLWILFGLHGLMPTCDCGTCAYMYGTYTYIWKYEIMKFLVFLVHTYGNMKIWNFGIHYIRMIILHCELWTFDIKSEIWYMTYDMVMLAYWCPDSWHRVAYTVNSMQLDCFLVYIITVWINNLALRIMDFLHKIWNIKYEIWHGFALNNVHLDC